MRLEQLTLRIPGDDVVMRFHDRLTVVSGMGNAERREMADLLVGALTGGLPHATELRYLDATGEIVLVRADGRGGVEHIHPDGSTAADLARAVGLDAAGLRKLVHLRADDVGILGADISRLEPPELRDARQALSLLDAELHEALGTRSRVEELRAELADIDERLRTVHEGEAKRRFARILIDLERVRAEAAVIRGGADSDTADRRLLAASEPVRRLAEAWRHALASLEQAQAAFADRERLDPRTLREALDAPSEIPAELDELATRWQAAERQCEALASRLSSEATAHLPKPSHPAVVRLARGDQERVWAVNQRVLDTGLRLEQASLALGGLEADGLAPTIVESLEKAHTEVEVSEHQIEERRLPGIAAATGGLLATAGALAALPVVAPVGLAGAMGAAAWAVVSPRRRLARARALEEDALTKAGAPTYLSFQMRRIDATIDPRTREALEVAALEHRRAQAEWQSLAGDLEAAEAMELEDEIREYARSLQQLNGAASEIETIRRQLETEAEPAARRARAELLAAAAPFGIDDPALAVQLVRHQAGVSGTARLQVALEAAELEEEQLREKLEARLAELGFDNGDVAARLGGFDWALGAASERTRARAGARPAEIVLADLARLEELARTEARPEWGAHVTRADAEEPDVEALEQRRAELAEAYRIADREEPDVERLTDRRNAVERRVAVLEAELSATSNAAPIEAADIEPHLLARLAQVRRPGTHDETLFLVLDEPFLRVQGERKWTVLDLVERLSDQVQMLYLTDDPDVVTWARRRVGAGSLTLMEPVAESV